MRAISFCDELTTTAMSAADHVELLLSRRALTASFVPATRSASRASISAQ